MGLPHDRMYIFNFNGRARRTQILQLNQPDRYVPVMRGCYVVRFRQNSRAASASE
ncbi:MAG: hypothetical protein RLZZ135_633 [Cyanobacteriota bacterium]